MTQVLKHIEQIIEKNLDNPVIKRRQGYINAYIDLGPADLVVIQWSSEKSLKLTKNSAKKSSYFNVYGVDCSSPSSIGAYVNSLINEQDKSGWMSSFKISSITYCLYDFMNNYDAYLEFSFPGSLAIKVLDVDNELVPFEEVQWEFMYVSSMLRNLEPKCQGTAKFYPHLETPKSFKEFMSVVASLFSLVPEKRRKQKVMNNIVYLPKSCLPDLISSRGNFLMNQICSFLVQTSRLEIGLEFFFQEAKKDRRNSVFLIELLSKWTPNVRISRPLAEMINAEPKSKALLFKEAEILSEKKFHSQAIELLKMLVQLVPNSFDIWALLIENYVESNDFIHALLALNAFPISLSSINFEEESNNKLDEENVPAASKIPPKIKDHISSSNRYHVFPESMDFRFSLAEHEILYLHSGQVDASNELNKEYEALKNYKMTRKMTRLYECFVKIKRKLGWKQLLVLFTKLFKGDATGQKVYEESSDSNQDEYESDSECSSEPKTISPSYTKKASQNVSADSDFEQLSPLMAGKLHLLKPLIAFWQTDTGRNETIRKMSGFLNVDLSQKKSSRKKRNSLLSLKILNSPMNDWTPTKSNKVSSGFGEMLEEIKEGEETSRAEVSNACFNETKHPIKETKCFSDETHEKTGCLPNEKAVDAILNKFKGNKKISIMRKWAKKDSYRPISSQKSNEFKIVGAKELEKMRTRPSSHLMNALLNNLFEDLNALYQWKAEEKEHGVLKALKMNPNPIYHGRLWVNRGFLAHRLGSQKWAYEGYFESLKTGFSFFGLYRLMQIHEENDEFEAMVRLSMAVLKEFNFEGYKNITYLPPLIEGSLLRMIRRHGTKMYNEILKKNRVEEEPLTKLASEFEKWKKTEEDPTKILTKLELGCLT